MAQSINISHGSNYPVLLTQYINVALLPYVSECTVSLDWVLLAQYIKIASCIQIRCKIVQYLLAPSIGVLPANKYQIYK